MMGRYSLDREGLVYAHEGNKGFAELVAEGAYKTFPADNDGILPLMDDEWFDDDHLSRQRVCPHRLGRRHLQENLEFIAESLFIRDQAEKRRICAGYHPSLSFHPVLERSSEDVQKAPDLLAVQLR
jgi:type II restriction/modification system DNA methylase subunit YeeA